MTQLSKNESAVVAHELHEQAVADFKVSERFAYSFIMKVKRIRDERFYKELGFPSFEEYCGQAWNTKRDFMDQRIQIAESFGEPNFADTYRQLGHSKSLLLARMEPATREQVEATIDVNEATVKQMKEAQRRIEEAERAAAQAQATADAEKNSARHFEKLWQQAKNQPPRVETKTVEVIPDHVKRKMEEQEFQIRNLRAGYNEAAEKLKQLEVRDTVDFDPVEAQKEREKMQHEADMTTINLRIAFKQFVEKAAITAYMQGAIVHSSASERERLSELVEAAEQIIDQTKLALRGRKLGVVNE